MGFARRLVVLLALLVVSNVFENILTAVGWDRIKDASR